MDSRVVKTYEITVIEVNAIYERKQREAYNHEKENRKKDIR